MEAATQNLQSVNQRSLYLDVVKAFMIIFVVFGHCIQYGSGSTYLTDQLFFENVLFKAIYSFHMPVFMLVSGYLFAISIQKRSLWHAVIHEIKTLLIPILLWSMIPFGLSMISLFQHNEVISLSVCFKKYIRTTLYNLWFLWAVFWCSLVVTIVNKIFRDNKIIYIMGALLSFFVPDIFNLHLYKFMYPFFLLGYFYHADDMKNKYKKIYSSNLFLAICGIAFALLLTMYRRESYIYTSGFDILGRDSFHQLCIDLYRFLIGVIGSVFIMILLKKTYKHLNTDILSVLSCIGQNSIGIYIISDYIYKYIYPYIYIYIINGNSTILPPGNIHYLITVFETIITLIISLFLTLWIKKSQHLNQFLLGGRM